MPWLLRWPMILMVIARYVDDPDSIHCIDDCAPFVLTNVMGPVRIKKADWPFLSGVNM